MRWFRLVLSFALGVGPSHSNYSFNNVAVRDYIFPSFQKNSVTQKVILSHETTVKRNLANISAGIKTIPADIFMWRQFGNDLFRATPRLGMAPKSLKIKRAEEPRTQVRFTNSRF